MGECTKLDGAAMDAIADYLETAASDILMVGLNWPEAEHLSPGFDLHVESARLWLDSVIERMEVWTTRARQIAAALDRAGARRLK
jgi:hypothetical protein